jgi:hypothetical protein
MAGTTDSGSSTRSELAGSLTIRRSIDGYHFELDLPSSGGGLRPTIWSGSQVVDDDTLSLLRGVLNSVTGGLHSPAIQSAPAGATMVVAGTLSQLEQLGKLMFRYVLPDEVQEELVRYTGPLLLSTDDASFPWELIHTGRDFLALSHAVGRRLVVSMMCPPSLPASYSLAGQPTIPSSRIARSMRLSDCFPLHPHVRRCAGCRQPGRR